MSKYRLSIQGSRIYPVRDPNESKSLIVRSYLIGTDKIWQTCVFSNRSHLLHSGSSSSKNSKL